MNSFERNTLSFLLVVVLGASINTVLAQTCQDGIDEWYTIRNELDVDFILDGWNISRVEIHPEDGSTTQMWYLQCGTQLGYYSIFNGYQTGWVLDVGQLQTTTLSVRNASVLTQEWFLKPNGAIGNADYLSVLDINGGVVSAGLPIVINVDEDHLSQRWILRRVFATDKVKLPKAPPKRVG